MVSIGGPMEPTFIGYIGSTKDALLVVQGVLNNRLFAVPRRPHDRERMELIRSGSVFVFIEERSGIKRWTDGVAWSPSRILGRFLVYRELDRLALNSIKGDKFAGFGGSTDKKLLTKKRKSLDGGLPSSSETTKTSPLMESSTLVPLAEGTSSTSVNAVLNDQNSNTVSNRSLVGSLIASYAFKDDGLIKKTLSLTIKRANPTMDPNVPTPVETYHLVSYYSADDVLTGRLIRPVEHPDLKDLPLSPELWNAAKESSLGGKIPMEDESYYSIDESNPNAAALGFSTGAHYQNQYQQQGSEGQSLSQVSQPSPQQQQQVGAVQSNSQSHPLPQQGSTIQQIQPSLPHQGSQLGTYPFGTYPGPAFPQYQQQIHQQQQQQLPQHVPSSLQHQSHEHRNSSPMHNQQSASFSLPHPLSNNGSNQQPSEYFSDLNASVQYQPQHIQQYRYNQGFVPPSTAIVNPYSYINQIPPQHLQQQHTQSLPLQHQHYQFQTPHQGSNTSSTSTNSTQLRDGSPPSPTKIKHENSPLSVAPANFNPNHTLNISLMTPRANSHQHSISGGSTVSNSGLIHTPTVPTTLQNTPGLGHQVPLGFPPNLGGQGSYYPGANNGRWYYDENGQIAPYAGGFQQFGPQG